MVDGDVTERKKREKIKKLSGREDRNENETLLGLLERRKCFSSPDKPRRNLNGQRKSEEKAGRGHCIKL